jgi:hypothetical protein
VIEVSLLYQSEVVDDEHADGNDRKDDPNAEVQPGAGLALSRSRAGRGRDLVICSNFGASLALRDTGILVSVLYFMILYRSEWTVVCIPLCCADEGIRPVAYA